jgi:hypothetical protein
MTGKTKSRYHIKLLVRPGRRWPEGKLRTLVQELRDVSRTCFDELPDYQVMRGTRDELSDKVIAVARRADGVMAGYCSAVVLPVAGVGKVLHLGLTCVRPEDRGAGLTHLLTRKVVQGYLVRRKLLGRLWVSNCAAVLSSLGNVALHFDDVYPSPFLRRAPTGKHYRIAATIDRRYRDKMYVRRDARFDLHAFIFRGSVKDTVFQKEADDAHFHHRRRALNNYYRGLMDFDAGDEVLQIGHVSLLTALRYRWRRRREAHAGQSDGFRPFMTAREARG